MARANSVSENVLYTSREKPPTLCPPATESRSSVTLRSVQQFQIRWTSDFYVKSAKMCTNQKRSWSCPNTHEHRPAFCQRICMNHRCKKRFLCFFILVTFLRFSTFFYFGGNVFFICCLNDKKQWACTGPNMSNYTVIHKNVAVCFWS